MDQPVTEWLSSYRSGDPDAAEQLWNFLSRRILGLARKEVRRAPTGAFDEEDVAQSAFHALCDAIQSDRYNEVADREDLWRLVATITVNKAKNRIQHENRLRRGGGMKRKSNDFLKSVGSDSQSAADELALRDECEWMIGLLKRDELKHVAVLKLEGLPNSEIAMLLNCSARSIQRRILLIRDIWKAELNSQSSGAISISESPSENNGPTETA